MTLFYTLGGGWGHLRRVQVFIENEGIIDYKVLTSNPLAERLFRKEDIIVCKNATVGELPDHMAFFHAVLGKYSITKLYVDVFPQGIMGELSMLSVPAGVSLYLLCRRLKWENYLKWIDQKSVQYDTAYILEPLEEAHDKYLQQHAREVLSYDLKYPEPGEVKDKSIIRKDRPLWLIVHGFNKEEVEALHRYALELALKEKEYPRLILISDRKVHMEGIEQLFYFPAFDFFPYADRLFTACGYNIMQETKRYRDKQVTLPFPRKYDDQFWRKRNM
ncbi:MAG: hypothetical protein OEY51_03295 [Cyclobacteriaceae bacterium]|nr:hypothetical protein [Cyclobacteriaceae bacterium]